MRVFYLFAAVAALSLLINLAGRWAGDTISMGGHTDDRTVHEIVIGNNVLAVPANAIRFERARRAGVAARIDLYLLWPDMEGYAAAYRDQFNQAGDTRSIVFVSYDGRMTSRDMSGRLDPIYRSLIEDRAGKGPAGLEYHAFKPNSGYVDELLAIGRRPDGAPFVARCLTGAAAKASLAPCERDVHVGDHLSLLYRFPAELLPDWKALDDAIMAKSSEFLQSGR